MKKKVLPFLGTLKLIVKLAIVSSPGTIIDFVIQWLFFSANCEWNIIIQRGIAYFSGVVLAFFLLKKYVFNVEDRILMRFLRQILWHVISFVCQIFVLYSKNSENWLYIWIMVTIANAIFMCFATIVSTFGDGIKVWFQTKIVKHKSNWILHYLEFSHDM